MENIVALFSHLKLLEKNLDIYYGQKVLQPALDRMMKKRRVALVRIIKVQVRTFNRDD